MLTVTLLNLPVSANVSSNPHNLVSQTREVYNLASKEILSSNVKVAPPLDLVPRLKLCSRHILTVEYIDLKFLPKHR